MELKRYIFTINKNSGFKLDPDELKDVTQEITIYLSQKNYNDLITKKTVLSFYINAVKKKQKTQDLVLNECYLVNHDPGAHEQEEDRLEKMKKLNLSEKQSKILELLVKGYTYPEIRKRFKMNENKLRNFILRMKKRSYGYRAEKYS